MHPEQMLERAPHSPMAGTGWLHGWRLTFGGEDIGWEGALATLVEDPLEKVFVVLYDMTESDEANLDRWEGGLPSARYLGVMADAAEIAGAPAEYVRDLRTRPARNIGPGTVEP